MAFNANSFPIAQKENSKPDMKSPIPQELIPSIFLLLPVKSLCRFKSVSKSFMQLIDGPDFINKQLETSLENKTHRKMMFEGALTEQRSKSGVFWVCDTDGVPQEKIPFRRLSIINITQCGYYNGLFLLAPGLLSFILWNPATKQYRNLPTCPLKTTNMSDYYNFRLGLGYDSVNDDYKVVSIPKKDGSEAWVFGLKSNIWRRIDCDVFPDAPAPEYFIACFAHGSLYWLYESPVTSLKEIVAFDVAKEKFSPVICPVAGSIIGLHVLDGCLCVSVLCYSITTEVHLYVTKKDGDDYFWHKICSVALQQQSLFDERCFEMMKIVEYSEERDEIMMDIGLKCMISYNLKQNSSKKVAAYKFGRPPVMFTESLVSVGAGKTTKILDP